VAIAATAVFRKLQKFFLTPPTPTNKPTRKRASLWQTQNKDKNEFVAKNSTVIIAGISGIMDRHLCRSWAQNPRSEVSPQAPPRLNKKGLTFAVQSFIRHHVYYGVGVTSTSLTA